MAGRLQPENTDAARDRKDGQWLPFRSRSVLTSGFASMRQEMMERETGLEPATLCLGRIGSPSTGYPFSYSISKRIWAFFKDRIADRGLPRIIAYTLHKCTPVLGPGKRARGFRLHACLLTDHLVRCLSTTQWSTERTNPFFGASMSPKLAPQRPTLWSTGKGWPCFGDAD